MYNRPTTSMIKSLTGASGAAVVLFPSAGHNSAVKILYITTAIVGFVIILGFLVTRLILRHYR
jgi:hypothetical protein